MRAATGRMGTFSLSRVGHIVFSFYYSSCETNFCFVVNIEGRLVLRLNGWNMHVC